MMISPMVYNELHKDDTLEDLIKERNYLIKAIEEFENNKEELMQNAIINCGDVTISIKLIVISF